MMKLYNTLSRTVEEIKPLQPPKVNVYSCGPTVYDYPHVGNWFTFIRYDLLVRALKANGFTPEWVMNITDVGHLVSDADEGEDKLEKGAKREGKTAWDIARSYGEYFETGLKRLNFTPPDYLPKATEHIAEQIALIKTLEDKGYTYVIDDGVYFETGKFADYGKFAQLELDELQAGARVEINPQKHSKTDFALWKFSPPGQKRDMEWDSPWGKGFPGWHVECSAMCMKYLGETIDIHAGGIDHIPVHHTNEIAQSEAATGKPFARYWMHANHILINDAKIAKSAGNGITLEDIETKGYSLEAFRLLVLESHYRSQSKFSWDTLAAAQNRLQDLRAMAALRWQPRGVTHDAGTFTLEDVPEELARIMADDLDTPQALAYLSQVSTQLQTVHIERDMVDHFERMLAGIDALLGLNLSGVTDITAEQKALLERREAARSAGKWQEADRLRDELRQQGVGLNDAAHGVIWYPL